MTSTNPKLNRAKGYHRFVDEAGEEYGSFEVFWDDSDIPVHGGSPRNYDADGNPVEPGWYWWACMPGCLPDGEATGPFETSALAYHDALSEG